MKAVRSNVPNPNTDGRHGGREVEVEVERDSKLGERSTESLRKVASRDRRGSRLEDPAMGEGLASYGVAGAVARRICHCDRCSGG